MDIFDIIFFVIIALFAIVGFLVFVKNFYSRKLIVFTVRNIHTNLYEVYIDKYKIYETENLSESYIAKKYYSDLVEYGVITKRNVKRYESKCMK